MGGSIVQMLPLIFLVFSLFPQDLPLGKVNCLIIKNLGAKWVLKDLT